MNETKSMVKSALGLILALIIVVGGIYGFNVKVEVQDTEVGTQETTSVETPNSTTAIESGVSTENADDETESTKPVTTQKPTSTTDSTPVVDEQPDVDNSADTEVTEPTEEESTVTEGEVENA